jgi:hypothetical protein
MSRSRKFEVVPHVGIGPLRLGMTPEEVRAAAAAAGHAVEDVRGGDTIVPIGLSVDYSADGLSVVFIEAFRAPGVCLTFAGCEVFMTSADEMVAAIVQQEGLNSADFPPGRHDYLFPSLRLALWRSTISDEDDEPGEQGWAFDSISLHVPGYYDQPSAGTN